MLIKNLFNYFLIEFHFFKLKKNFLDYKFFKNFIYFFYRNLYSIYFFYRNLFSIYFFSLKGKFSE
jgi:hypothetical protein